MISDFDETLWREAISKPNWYDFVAADFRHLELLAKQAVVLKDDSTRQRIRHDKQKAYTIIEEALNNNIIPLATSGENLDKERKPIDTIVIHHTGNNPGMSLNRLNAIQLLRVYGLYYNRPTNSNEEYFKGLPIWSNHFYKTEQVFWVYHWFIREDGTAEEILKDDCVGWHAGNWGINTRSIALCVDDDLTNKEPSVQALGAIIDIIKKLYPSVKPERILGHSDVSVKTECPGRLFRESWQKKLIN